MNSQHYRISLAEAIAGYQSGDFTAKGLLHYYLKIRLKAGWTLKESQKEICERLGISRAAFYSALSKLKAEGSINWSTPANTKFSISLAVCERGQDSTIVDEPSTIVDEPSTIVDTTSTYIDTTSIIVTVEKTEGIQSKVSKTPSNSSSNSYQIYINSLSEEQRESFVEFGKKKAGQLPRPPELPLKWIETHFEELRPQWEKSSGIIHCNQNWENDPRRQLWLDKIRTLGFASFIYEEGEMDRERQNFYEWANSLNLIWGAEA